MSLRNFEPTVRWANVDGTLTERAKGYLRALFDYIGAGSGTVPVGSVGGDGTTTKFYRADGEFAVPAYSTPANPTSSIGTAAVNGTAVTFLRSDAAQALSQSIVPTWTGAHTFTLAPSLSDGAVIAKTSGVGIKVDTAAPTFGWRDLLGSITVKGAGGGGIAANPDYVVYRGGLYAYRFGTNAPNNHNHEAFIEYHIPHDYVPSSDMFIHVHWSQIVVDTGGAAAVPGVAKWYFEVSYADGHGTAGGAADPFIAPFTVSVTQQGSTTQYGHMIAEVQFTGASLAASTIQVDGLILVRIYRDPTDVGDTLDQDTFVHSIDIHYMSTNIATKNKAPDFYG